MKRILATLLVLFMCLGITACRNSSQKKPEIRDVFQMNPVMLDENFMGISAMRATENAVFLLGASRMKTRTQQLWQSMTYNRKA